MTPTKQEIKEAMSYVSKKKGKRPKNFNEIMSYLVSKRHKKEKKEMTPKQIHDKYKEMGAKGLEKRWGN